MSRHPSGVFTAGAKRGQRLANPRDPAVKLALKRSCPDCEVAEGEWCVGIAEGPTKGKRLTRIHFNRCLFAAADGMSAKPATR